MSEMSVSIVRVVLCDCPPAHNRCSGGISVASGSVGLIVGDVHSAILHRFYPDQYESSWLADVCVWNLRFPRILMGILAGIGLGTAGALMTVGSIKDAVSPWFTDQPGAPACAR